MFHPLLEDLQELNDQQLQDRATDIARKLTAAYRMSSNGALIQQMQLVNGQIQEEVKRRQRVELDKLMSNNKKDFNNIIDIK
jgi:hypothetical protein